MRPHCLVSIVRSWREFGDKLLSEIFGVQAHALDLRERKRHGFVVMCRQDLSWGWISAHKASHHCVCGAHCYELLIIPLTLFRFKSLTPTFVIRMIKDLQRWLSISSVHPNFSSSCLERFFSWSSASLRFILTRPSLILVGLGWAFGAKVERANTTNSLWLYPWCSPTSAIQASSCQIFPSTCSSGILYKFFEGASLKRGSQSRFHSYRRGIWTRIHHLGHKRRNMAIFQQKHLLKGLVSISKGTEHPSRPPAWSESLKRPHRNSHCAWTLGLTHLGHFLLESGHALFRLRTAQRCRDIGAGNPWNIQNPRRLWSNAGRQSGDESGLGMNSVQWRRNDR